MSIVRITRQKIFPREEEILIATLAAEGTDLGFYCRRVTGQDLIISKVL